MPWGTKPNWWKKESGGSTPITVRRQEEAAGRLVGGRRRSGSGSNPLAKGDFLSRDILGECKQTAAKSLSVSRAMLHKIEAEATAEGKHPMLHVEFVGPHPRGMEDLSSRWVMVPDWKMKELME